VLEIAKDPDLAKQYEAAGIEAQAVGPAELKAALDRESARVAETVKAAGLKPQ
jgi:tripartite-type tricarboxylate transporter receptor subunit TctC